MMREYNELPTAKSKNIGQIALEVVREPMFVLLLSSSTEVGVTRSVCATKMAGQCPVRL